MRYNTFRQNTLSVKYMENAAITALMLFFLFLFICKAFVSDAWFRNRCAITNAISFKNSNTAQNFTMLSCINILITQSICSSEYINTHRFRVLCKDRFYYQSSKFIACITMKINIIHMNVVKIALIVIQSNIVQTGNTHLPIEVQFIFDANLIYQNTKI